jgi:hypothetical protein
VVGESLLQLGRLPLQVGAFTQMWWQGAVPWGEALESLSNRLTPSPEESADATPVVAVGAGETHGSDQQPLDLVLEHPHCSERSARVRTAGVAHQLSQVVHAFLLSSSSCRRRVVVVSSSTGEAGTARYRPDRGTSALTCGAAECAH